MKSVLAVLAGALVARVIYVWWPRHPDPPPRDNVVRLCDAIPDGVKVIVITGWDDDGPDGGTAA